MGRVLERGDLFFFYRPRVEGDEADEAAGADDVQRFFFVLEPDGAQRLRQIVIGRKRLPDPESHERGWGVVALVTDDPAEMRRELEPTTYETKASETGTRGVRVLPEARPAGEARYAIVEHERHTHFAYALELPSEPGPVQRELRIKREASYIIAVRNPETPAPPGAGLTPRERADYPPEFLERFDGRRFSLVDPPSLLDFEGAELVLIGAAEDVSDDLDVDLDAESEALEHSDILHDLRLRLDELKTEPLERGTWR